MLASLGLELAPGLVLVLNPGPDLGPRAWDSVMPCWVSVWSALGGSLHRPCGAVSPWPWAPWPWTPRPVDPASGGPAVAGGPAVLPVSGSCPVVGLGRPRCSGRTRATGFLRPFCPDFCSCLSCSRSVLLSGFSLCRGRRGRGAGGLRLGWSPGLRAWGGLGGPEPASRRDDYEERRQGPQGCRPSRKVHHVSVLLLSPFVLYDVRTGFLVPGPGFPVMVRAGRDPAF